MTHYKQSVKLTSCTCEIDKTAYRKTSQSHVLVILDNFYSWTAKKRSELFFIVSIMLHSPSWSYSRLCAQFRAIIWTRWWCWLMFSERLLVSGKTFTLIASLHTCMITTGGVPCLHGNGKWWVMHDAVECVSCVGFWQHSSVSMKTVSGCELIKRSAHKWIGVISLHCLWCASFDNSLCADDV